jgi:hypothetical protein
MAMVFKVEVAERSLKSFARSLVQRTSIFSFEIWYHIAKLSTRVLLANPR